MNVVVACNNVGLVSHDVVRPIGEGGEQTNLRHYLTEHGMLHGREVINAYVRAIAADVRHGALDVEADPYFASSVIAMAPDIVFNIARGLVGPAKASYVPVILDSLRVPYTGSDALTMTICEDKFTCNSLLKAGGIPVPSAIFVERIEDVTSVQMNQNDFPVIVKPNSWYWSKGIYENSICETQEDLVLRIEDGFLEGLGPFIVQQFIPGRDLTLCFLGEDLLPIIETVHENLGQGASILDWPSRVMMRVDADFAGATNAFKVAQLHQRRLAATIEQIGRRVIQQFNVRDWATIDIRLGRDGVPYVIDVNPLPDLLPDPALHTPMGASIMAAGLSFDEVVHFVLDSAITRHGVEERSQHAVNGVVEEAEEQQCLDFATRSTEPTPHRAAAPPTSAS